jgi:AraC-like DNA-binding protein/tetratricopeptide (TPR) repeat protein
MNSRLLPRGLKAAIELIQRDFARAWTVDEVASACGLARRTLQAHFRRFIGAAPLEFLRVTRLAEARRQLLRAKPPTSVTGVAMACGFTHLGRFAGWYRERYGESPSDTLEGAHSEIAAAQSSLPSFSLELARPSVAVLPFDLIGPESLHAAALEDEIAAALCRCRWFSVVAPSHARYYLRGKVRGDGSGRLRVAVALLDASTERYLLADRWDGAVDDVFAFEDAVAQRLVRAMRSPVRDAEIDRAWRGDPAQLTAWELTMRALRGVVSAEPAAGTTLEWLERAMELAPQDPLPMSLAAWCHSVRASHHQTRQPDRERQAARRFADRASLFGNGDPMAEAMLATAYTLAQDLDAASVHAGRALSYDAGSAWAWGRSGWIHAYRGDSAGAIERFRIALALAPRDPLGYQWSLGIASAHFEAARYRAAMRWSRRALLEQPKAITINRLLAPACALAGAKDDAHQSFRELKRHFPGLTIADVTAALPLTLDHLSRRAEGLESVGMRPS